jgi:hypothetical protein
MTFLEAALDILKREGRPLHFKELTERAMTKKLLTFVGRTPEVTMQTQLTSAVKKAPGNPFVRVKPGVFGLLRYPELTAEEKAAASAEEKAAASPRAPKREREEAPEGEAQDRTGRRRRRRGGRSRTGKADEAAAGEAKEPATEDTGADDAIEEPNAGGLSAAARAAALAETGVLEGDDDSDGGDDEDQDHDELSAEDESAPVEAAPEGAQARTSGDSEGQAAAEDDGEGDEDEAADGEGGDEPATSGAPAEAGEEGGRRRRRRRRRRRGGEEDGGRPGDTTSASGANGDRPQATGDRGSFGEPQSGQSGESGESVAPTNGDAGQGTSAGSAPSEGATSDNQAARKIMTPVDAAIEVLRGQPPGRGVHVRQLADSAIRRRLIHGEPNEAWRVIRTALATEPKERLRNGQRPRVRAAGSGLYALARRTPDAELEKAEQVFGDARRALRERTMAAIERRLADLAPGAFEAVARVLLQREGFGPTTFVKRVEGTIYVEALRGRGSRPSRCLIALRPGSSSPGRRAIGELRAGIEARQQDEGLLMLAGRLGDDAIAAWKQAGPPIEIADGQALAETCLRNGVGVINATISVDFVDADFFADLAEG